MAIESGKFQAWEDIESVFLDMDGTLLDLYFDNHFWLEHMPVKYAEANRISHEQAKEELMARYSAARGTLDWYCIDYWSHQLKMDIRQLKNNLAHNITIRPKVSGFLETVNASEKRVVLVTNAHPATVEIKMDQTGIHHHFDRIINSHEIGLAKEQTGFWSKLNEYEEYDSKKTMLIDDNLEVLRSAQDYGIAFLYGVLQPDSQQGHVDASPFTAIDDLALFASELAK